MLHWEQYMRIRQREWLEEAEHNRLVHLAQTSRPRKPTRFRRVLAWVGMSLGRLAESLQKPLGEVEKSVQPKKASCQV